MAEISSCRITRLITQPNIRQIRCNRSATRFAPPEEIAVVAAYLLGTDAGCGPQAAVFKMIATLTPACLCNFFYC